MPTLSAISPPPTESSRHLETLALDHIAKPIPGPSPAGVPLRYEPEYDLIREARRDEDPSLPQGIWQRDLKRADWNRVIALCAEVLGERSKDLQVACWLVEALVRSRGLPGLAEGLRGLATLCEGFWREMFPSIEDGDVTARIAPIEWLNDKLPTVLYTLPLTAADSADAPAYSWTDYINAQRRDIARGNDTRVATTVVLDDFFTAVGATSTAFYEQLAGDVGHCLDCVAALQTCLDQWCGEEGPSLAQLREALGSLQAFVDALLAQRVDKVPLSQPAPAANESEEVLSPMRPSEPTPSPPRLLIHSRDEAYRFLVEIAEYLFAVEPHSPTPYIIQRAASWGNMPLNQLLIELTKGNNDLSALFDLLGVGHDDGPTTKPGSR